MKKPKPPKTFQEVEDYIRKKKLNVNAEIFWNVYDVADWYDNKGQPVLCWKGRLWSWHGRDKKTISAHNSDKISHMEIETYKKRIRDGYQDYLEDKKTPALLDMKKDNGPISKLCGWLIDEILSKRKDKDNE